MLGGKIHGKWDIGAEREQEKYDEKISAVFRLDEPVNLSVISSLEIEMDEPNGFVTDGVILLNEESNAVADPKVRLSRRVDTSAVDTLTLHVERTDVTVTDLAFYNSEDEEASRHIVRATEDAIEEIREMDGVESVAYDPMPSPMMSE